MRLVIVSLGFGVVLLALWNQAVHFMNALLGFG